MRILPQRWQVPVNGAEDVINALVDTRLVFAWTERVGGARLFSVCRVNVDFSASAAQWLPRQRLQTIIGTNIGPPIGTGMS